MNRIADNKADTFLRMIRRSQRGRLKIYLGYAAGVGKTYQMLLEGRRLKEEKIDMVVGLVETHGRIETEKLLDGLEVMPRRRMEYRGIVVEEMDVEALLARKPQVALVDELAHTNAPGSRNEKRYQDVQDIIAAGIHVITTINIQHLESLYDTVEKAVRVKVRERLPDSVIAEADQIVSVDLSTEDLRKRLKEGKVYTVERIEVALEHFFQISNLEKLRELTLRELASQIDLRRRESLDEEDPASPDQVMVCLSSRGPKCEMLLRYGSRLAGKLNRNWYAVYVQTPSEDPSVIDLQTQQILSGTLTLAKQLGAIVFTYRGEDVVRTLLQFAKEYRVGHIVTGSPERISLWKKIRGKRGIIDRLIHEAKGATITVLDTRQEENLQVEPPLEGKKTDDAARQKDATGSLLSLSRLVSPERIVIWNDPATKEEVIHGLVETTKQTGETGDSGKVLSAILERERTSSTFLNEGVAFPHLRIEGLKNSMIGLGLTRNGVIDAGTEKPVEIVFLILSPASHPEEQINILALASRASQDRHFLQELRSCQTVEEVITAIGAWSLH